MDESEVLPPAQLLITEAREGGRLGPESPGLLAALPGAGVELGGEGGLQRWGPSPACTASEEPHPASALVDGPERAQRVKPGWGAVSLA